MLAMQTPTSTTDINTVRYLCLIAILCDPEPPPLVCIEEPELGLHPDVLPKLADLLKELHVRCRADHSALRVVFRNCLQDSALLGPEYLETRTRDEVQTALEHATRTCGPRRMYRKDARSFEALAALNPDHLKTRLCYFARLLRTLD
jgi:hypothetical protein